jgi:hypothetical protein
MMRTMTVTMTVAPKVQPMTAADIRGSAAEIFRRMELDNEVLFTMRAFFRASIFILSCVAFSMMMFSIVVHRHKQPKVVM